MLGVGRVLGGGGEDAVLRILVGGGSSGEREGLLAGVPLAELAGAHEALGDLFS